MKVTYKKIALFRNAGAQYLRILGGKMNHLGRAITKVTAQTTQFVEEYEDQIRDLRADYALVKDEHFVTNEKTGEYEIDPKRYKEFAKKIKSLNDLQVDIEPVLAQSVPKDLGLDWYELFIPFVVEDYPEPVEEGEKKEGKE